MTLRSAVILGTASALMVCLALPVGVGGPAILPGGWLALSEPPEAADLLVVVSGGAMERLLAAAGLYRAGYAPALLLTGIGSGPSEADLERIAAAGVPRSAVVEAPRASSSTLEDALCIRQVVISKGFRSILVVTSPYHCRRLRLILDRTLADLDVRVTVTASASLYFDPNRWWEDPQGWDLIPAEYLKLLWAWATVPRAASQPR